MKSVSSNADHDLQVGIHSVSKLPNARTLMVTAEGELVDISEQQWVEALNDSAVVEFVQLGEHQWGFGKCPKSDPKVSKALGCCAGLVLVVKSQGCWAGPSEHPAPISPSLGPNLFGKILTWQLVSSICSSISEGPGATHRCLGMPRRFGCQPGLHTGTPVIRGAQLPKTSATWHALDGIDVCQMRPTKFQAVL